MNNFRFVIEFNYVKYGFLILLIGESASFT